jgi:beta-lactamase regulating signal transducer with metallopeptidase domain
MAGVDLVVLDDEQRAAAYALPGPAGRIVVTSALLRRLDGPERRAVLAHERSHLQHRHYLYVQFAELAAGANPLLRPAARATRLAVERWADEDAVTSVGDRRTVARALAKAGLARRTPPREAALAAAETELAGRVHSLLDPPSARRGRWVVAGLVGAAVLAMSSAVAFGFNAHQLFETAQAAYLAHRG